MDMVQPEADPYNAPTLKTTLVPNMWIAHLKLSQLKATILFPASKLYRGIAYEPYGV